MPLPAAQEERTCVKQPEDVCERAVTVSSARSADTATACLSGEPYAPVQPQQAPAADALQQQAANVLSEAAYDVSDDEGSVLHGAPVTNPLHLLSQRRHVCAPGRSALDTRRAGIDAATPAAARIPTPQAAEKRPHSPAPPRPLPAPRHERPQAVCRRDLSRMVEDLQSGRCHHLAVSHEGGSAPAAQPHAAALPAAQADAAAGPSQEAREASADSRPAKKRRKQGCFPHGNYNRYYGYRLADAFDEDPRLQALDAAWFAGKRVLDVGCNEGVLTLSLACKFACKAALGVDIDAALVAKASRSLAALRGQYTRQLTTPGLGAGPQHAAGLKAARSAVKVLKKTRFEHRDFLEGGRRRARFDVVLCLSVTKWVHFNRGDEGVRELFRRVRHALHPGGVFVLEPQPWRSYRQVLKKQETVAALPFKELSAFQLRPAAFAAHLTGELGFELLAERSIGDAAKGFDRPLLVFRKPQAEAQPGA